MLSYKFDRIVTRFTFDNKVTLVYNTFIMCT